MSAPWCPSWAFPTQIFQPQLGSTSEARAALSASPTIAGITRVALSPSSRKAARTCSPAAVRVPELTCATNIKLNMRVSLRPIQTRLAWLQSCRWAPKFGLRTARSGAASYPRGGPAPQRQRPRRRYAAWPDAGTVPLLARFRRRQDSSERAGTFPITKEARQVELAGFLRGYEIPRGLGGNPRLPRRYQAAVYKMRMASGAFTTRA